MKISSSAFDDGGEIPRKYTFDGENCSPPLTISDVPSGTESLVVMMEDIDSPIGPFTHWVLWNIAPDTTEIPEDTTPPGSQTGINGFGQAAWGGPCPPSGRHRYRFHLLALDTMLESTTPDRRDQIENEMDGNVLARATLTGLYQADS